MTKASNIFDQTKKFDFILLLSSFTIYFYFFHHLFLNLNSVLSSSTGDAIKNYFTFIFHVKHDTEILHFSGMNFPFGEHVVYTDCQPLISAALKVLPFTHNYLIGTLHCIMLFSLIITPLVINKIMLRVGIDKVSSFFISLAIAILSPQIRRFDGHFALSYECLIPITILLILKFFQDNNKLKLSVILLFYNFGLFLIHPYIGFGSSVMCLLSIIFFLLIRADKKNNGRDLFYAFASGFFPILAFKFFMLVSDQHINRTTEPDGIAALIASPASVFVPNSGPFKSVLKNIISDAPQEYEGLAYVSLFCVMLIAVTALIIPFIIKRLRLQKDILCIFLASVVLLLFSFGIHNWLFDTFHIKTNLFNQFRALGRFAWFFYYALPVFLIAFLYQSFAKIISAVRLQTISLTGSILFFGLNFIEAHNLLYTYSHDIFRDRNFFNPKLLNAEEKINISKIKKEEPQAILTLPAFFLGSEVYSRQGNDRSMVPAIIYCFHTKTPIWGSFLSRTSISETADNIELLNAYKEKRTIIALLNEQPFFVITTNESLLPDEERLNEKVNSFGKNDSLSYGFIEKKKLLHPAFQNPYNIYEGQKQTNDSMSVYFIQQENRKPFVTSQMSDYQSVFTLDSLKIESGKYIVSLHFHYKEKTFRDVYSHLVLINKNRKQGSWEKTAAVRLFSGFYKGFAVFECAVDLERKNNYEFLLYGFGDRTYKISDFMLRPAATDVRVIYKNGDTSINNFPIKGF